MAVIDERARRLLHKAFVRVLGEGEADTAMALLPPVGWADVATKQDLENLRTVLTSQLRKEMSDLRAELHIRLGELQKEMNRQTRVFVLGFGSMIIAIIGLPPVLDRIW